MPDLLGLRVGRIEQLREPGQRVGAPGRGLEPRVLRACELVARLPQQRLAAHDVGIERLGGRNERRQVVRALHRGHFRRRGLGGRDVVEHLAPQPVGDLCAAFGDAPDLHVDAGDELLGAEASLERAGLKSLEQRRGRPPERAQVRLRGQVLDRHDGLAHRPGPRVGAAQPFEQPTLVLPPLLEQQRRKARGGHDLGLRRTRCAHVEIGIEQVGRRRRVDAARLLHRFVFAEQRQRHGRRAVGDLVEEYAQPAHGVIDEIHDGGHVGSRQLLEPHELPLDFVGECDDGVETHHLDGARRLMDVGARMLERRRVRGGGAKRRQRRGAARQRLVDFTLDPRQWPEIELGCGFTQHALAPRDPLPGKSTLIP